MNFLFSLAAKAPAAFPPSLLRLLAPMGMNCHAENVVEGEKGEAKVQ